MYCVVKCIVCGKQAHVKNADLRHPSCTVVMYRRKSASPIHNVLTNRHIFVTLMPAQFQDHILRGTNNAATFVCVSAIALLLIGN